MPDVPDDQLIGNLRILKVELITEAEVREGTKAHNLKLWEHHLAKE